MTLGLRSCRVLNRYLAGLYLRNLLIVVLALLAVIYMFDTLELLRRASKQDGVPTGLVLTMGLLKLPDVGQQLFPFGVLFSALFTFWQLTRRHELVVVRAVGLSAWQFLLPVLATAFAAGVLLSTVINPMGALLLSRYEQLESEHLSLRKSQVTLLREGLWLRQTGEGGHVILHAAKVSLPAWELQDVMVLYFNGQDELARRLDAKRARLEPQQWVFQDVLSHYPRQQRGEKMALVILPTDLTAEEIEESFANPEALSFWKLPGFIHTLEETGFDAARVRVYFQNLIAQPVLFVAMIFLAAAVALRPPRQRNPLGLILAGVLAGFFVFFLSNFLQALGATHQIPVLLAAWATPLVCLLLGATAVMSLEDG